MECTDLEGFSETARDHAMRPRNHGPMKVFDGHARITGPCGDTMEFWVGASGDTVTKASFVTDGCASSLACGSMATCLAQGMRVEDAASLGQNDILDALGGFPPEVQHCALLAANTLKAACENCMVRQKASGRQSHGAQATCDTCDDTSCSAAVHKEGESEAELEERRKLQSRLCRIRHKVVVLSGKGGVGKSTVAVNLATSLMMSGKRVGLLDIDIHGPSIPTMLGLEWETIEGSDEGLLPLEMDGMKVMSLGFFLQNPDDAVIWRGPRKMGVIKQFLQDVAWGDLDYLVIDSPPGTGDEPLSLCQLIGQLDGAVIVTTPQKVAAVDVRKSISFCRQLHLPVLGVVENMSGFACPKCGEVTQILRSGGGRRMAEDMGVPFLGSIPMDPKIAEACDDGEPFIRNYSDTPTAQALRDIIIPIAALDETGAAGDITKPIKALEEIHMRIAIPLANGKLAMHFGHCECFALVDVDPKERKILKREDIDAPPHQPGLLPPWLAERGANMIIAGGMGQRAKALFAEQGVEVVVGARADTPENLVGEYLDGTLKVGENACDH
ncbi:MAG: iron-sulfur cluster carrier protein MrpORP [Candidatus Sumerlaeota bacterium]|nr:iron-sulfur cluster carrier protein MrpORP [Candidatus Sumerlaeota bacterium]